MIQKIWNDPVGSKLIAYGIAGLFSIIVSSIIVSSIGTNLVNENDKQDASILSVLLNTNVQMNLFIILTVLIFLIVVFISILYKNYVFTYDVFLSAPIPGFNNENEYLDFRKTCLEVVEVLKKECGYNKIYYAGETRENKKGLVYRR